MTNRTAVRAGHHILIAVLIAVMAMSQVSVVLAGSFMGGSAVGGVVIQIDGVVQNATAAQRATLARLRRADFRPAADELNRPVELRKISLKALEAACEAALRDENGNGRLPDEIRYLGGLLRVQYVFVYPDQNDIVLAGPAEGWKIDDMGNVVGITTGRPVVQLDDLVVALRTVSDAREGGISCSINPTPEGFKKLRELLSQQKQSRQSPNIPQLEQDMKQAFGPQMVSLTGVPPTSHFARVLVAADYRMKRLAMNLDPAPIAGFPSYVEMLQSDAKDPNVNPRWWLACNYEPVAKSDDNLAWELRGQGVKCLTEDDAVIADGTVRQTGKTSPTAQKWADMMTDRFDELTAKEPVFGELRNVMDLCIIAALIDQHDLVAQAGGSFPVLIGAADELLIPARGFIPKTVPPQCSFLKTRAGWVVTASGGVQIESFRIASQVETNPALMQVREGIAKPAGNTWWWN
ncbi:MAG: DUF1598 domain-containing protein [Pirellulaceae bacterium]